MRTMWKPKVNHSEQLVALDNKTIIQKKTDKIVLTTVGSRFSPNQGKYFPVYCSIGGARGVMVIVVGNGHGDMSSNPGRDW